MHKFKTYYYIVDSLDPVKVQMIKAALKTVKSISEIKISIDKSLVEVKSEYDIEENLKLACQVAGANYRLKAKEKDLYR